MKVASAPPAMECVGVDLFSFDDAPHAHVAERRPESWLRRRRAERANRTSRANEKPPPWTFVFQFMNPGPPYVSIACYFRPTGERAGMSLDALLAHDRDTPFGRTLRRFLDASDRERDAKFKMVAALTKAPWALRSAVPRRPVILGKKLASGLRYFRGEDHFEVDFELARNAFMDRAYRSLKWASERSEEEIVFLLEGQAEDELPERVLGAVALARVGEAALTKLPPLRAAEEGGGVRRGRARGSRRGERGAGGDDAMGLMTRCARDALEVMYCTFAAREIASSRSVQGRAKRLSRAALAVFLRGPLARRRRFVTECFRSSSLVTRRWSESVSCLPGRARRRTIWVRTSGGPPFPPPRRRTSPGRRARRRRRRRRLPWRCRRAWSGSAP